MFCEEIVAVEYFAVGVGKIHPETAVVLQCLQKETNIDTIPIDCSSET